MDSELPSPLTLCTARPRSPERGLGVFNVLRYSASQTLVGYGLGMWCVELSFFFFLLF